MPYIRLIRAIRVFKPRKDDLMHEFRKPLEEEPVIQKCSITVAAPHYADFGKRFGAAIIDGTLVIIAAWLLWTLLVWITGERSSNPTTQLDIFAIGVIVILILIFSYFTIMESSSKQATLGKMAAAIIVTDREGRKISFLTATGRYFAKYISMILLLIGYIMIAFTEKKQGLYDIIAETLVVVKQ